MLLPRMNRVAFGALLFFVTVVFLSAHETTRNHAVNVFDRLRSSGTPSPDPALAHFFPAAGPPFQHSLIAEGHGMLQALLSCLASGTCTENQKKIVLLQSWHFYGFLDGSTTGEAIWCGSILEALRELGYTLVFARDPEDSARLYKLFPDLVRVVLGEAPQSEHCFDLPECIKNPRNPLGIPIWKLFSFNIWPFTNHPLGGRWVLSIEDLHEIAQNHYIGYSLEPTCTQRQYIPYSEKEHRAFILGKRVSYWGPDCRIDKAAIAEAARPPMNLRFVGGAHNDTEDWTIQPPPELENLGFMSKENFFLEVAKSKVMVGLGLPLISPSPYDALCAGVPFINPVSHWDRDDPENRHKWGTQHDGMKYIEEPFVYHVKRDDPKGFLAALERAVNTPIDRYIAPWMTFEKLKERIAALVDNDWLTEATIKMEELRAEGKQTYEL